VDIDRNAPAAAEGSARIAAPPEIVWAVISDIAAWPTWNPDVRSVTFDGPLEPGSEFRWKSGSSSLVSRLEAVDPPREIGWTGTTMGIRAIHVFRFEPAEGGTLARSEESWSGGLAGLLKSFSRKRIQRAIDTALASLKTESERRAVG
jgi:uncharacterized protein YndB with AHSA1/START domain